MNITAKANEIQFSDEDVVNPQDFVPAVFPNIQEIQPWLFHDHGFPVAVVFAKSLDDALTIAADAGKLERFALDAEALKEYHPQEEGVSRLGNHGKPHDLQNLECIRLKNPPFSFVALYSASKG
jgi:hypothetical protein